MVTLFSAVHSEKAKFSIVSRASGRVMFSSAAHSLKAYTSIVVTLAGTAKVAPGFLQG